MKMPVSNLFRLRLVRTFSWEILKLNKKINRTPHTGGGFIHSLPHPRQDILRAGFNWGIIENFRDFKIISYLNRAAKAAGQSPRERD